MATKAAAAAAKTTAAKAMGMMKTTTMMVAAAAVGILCLECEKSRSFTLICKASNLSHNHPLSSQLTVVDGRSIVSVENFLTLEEF